MPLPPEIDADGVVMNPFDRVTRLEVKLLGVVEDLTEIKDGVKKLVSLETTISLALASANEQQRAVHAQWAKIDSMNERLDDVVRYKSSIRGALWAFGLVSFIGMGAVTWLFLTMLRVVEENIVQRGQISALEYQLMQRRNHD